jgi:hypothetical protein
MSLLSSLLKCVLFHTTEVYKIWIRWLLEEAPEQKDIDLPKPTLILVKVYVICIYNLLEMAMSFEI